MALLGDQEQSEIVEASTFGQGIDSETQAQKINTKLHFAMLVVSWLALMLLLRLQASVTDEASWNLLRFAIFLCFLLAPVAVIRLGEQRSVRRRLGLTSWRLGSYAAFLFAVVMLVFLSGVGFWDALEPVLLAPILEELFFRGFLLGTLSKYVLERLKGWKRETKLAAKGLLLLIAILPISGAFALAHMFKYKWIDVLAVFWESLKYSIAYLVTGSILLPTSMHAARNFGIVSNDGMAGQTWPWLLLLYLPAIVTHSVELLKAKDRIMDICHRLNG